MSVFIQLSFLFFFFSFFIKVGVIYDRFQFLLETCFQLLVIFLCSDSERKYYVPRRFRGYRLNDMFWVFLLLYKIMSRTRVFLSSSSSLMNSSLKPVKSILNDEFKLLKPAYFTSNVSTCEIFKHSN